MPTAAALAVPDIAAAPGVQPGGVPPVPDRLLEVPAQLGSAIGDAREAGRQLAHAWFRRSDTDIVDIPRFLQAHMPPVPGKQAEARELKELHRIAAARTPEDTATALFFREHGSFGLWHDGLKQYAAHAGSQKAIAAAADLYGAMGANLVATLEAKARNGRDRPFVTDPTLEPVVGRPSDKSYPSGHASSAYAAATVLGHHWPERADEFLKLAEQTAYSRVYGGVHFPSDVVTGALIGSAAGNIFIGEGKAAAGPQLPSSGPPQLSSSASPQLSSAAD